MVAGKQLCPLNVDTYTLKLSSYAVNVIRQFDLRVDLDITVYVWNAMKRYEKFDDWFWEIEGFGTRGERFFESLDHMSDKEGLEWLKACWECARNEHKESNE
jgi:hypothetical protein